MTPAMPPATVADGAILAAVNAVAMNEAWVIDPSVAVPWSAMQNGLGALQAVGDLTASDVAAITALTTVVVPRWPVVLTSADITSARSGTP